MIKTIYIENYKRIKSFTSDLEQINVLIGSNGSGKSSVLQAIHFCISAEAIRRKLQKTTIQAQDLLYLPSSNFLYLRHNSPYTVSSGYTSALKLVAEDEEDFTITISKGRNDGNISVNTKNNNNFRSTVTSYEQPYCIYVPGISGLANYEKYATPAEIKKGAARGDANLYLRNIIHQLSVRDELKKLNTEINKIFPGLSLEARFDDNVDLYVEVYATKLVNDTSVQFPIEQCGTGILQVIQILTYNIYFKPKLLLLDEPDEHLHPGNQIILSSLLTDIAATHNIQLLICTHSRHLITALKDSSKIIWLKAGSAVHEECKNIEYEALLDMGALDAFDECLAGTDKLLVFTEDSKVDYLECLLKANGAARFKIIKFEGCKKIYAVETFLHTLSSYNKNLKIAIHLDRDFMTDVEVDYYKQKIGSMDLSPKLFITRHSDIESYFCSSAHLAEALNLSQTLIDSIISEVLQEYKQHALVDYIRKRDICKSMPIYKNGNLTPPNDDEVRLRDFTKQENVVGKILLKKIMQYIRERKLCNTLHVKIQTPHLIDSNLQSILQLRRNND